jgi:hypothetical protein
LISDLGRLTVTRKNGDEEFHENGKVLDIKLLEFWQWSVSDLVSNVSRGVLAEFIVAKALSIDTTSTVRDEWAAYDLQTGEGIKVEVKSAAYIQSWHQNKLSSISFRTPKTLAWDPDTNSLDSEPSRAADVYVFALLAHKDKPTIDPLDVSQWCFYVMPTIALDNRTRSQHSITLRTLERLSSGPIIYHDLQEEVKKAYQIQNETAR